MKHKQYSLTLQWWSTAVCLSDICCFQMSVWCFEESDNVILSSLDWFSSCRRLNQEIVVLESEHSSLLNTDCRLLTDFDVAYKDLDVVSSVDQLSNNSHLAFVVLADD